MNKLTVKHYQLITKGGDSKKSKTLGRYAISDKKTGLNNLKKLRASRDITQQQISDIIGIAQAQYVRMEKGYANNPPLQTAYKLANYYNVNIYDIWEDDKIRLKRNGRRYLSDPVCIAGFN